MRSSAFHNAYSGGIALIELKFIPPRMAGRTGLVRKSAALSPPVFAGSKKAEPRWLPGGEIGLDLLLYGV